jgi:DNA-binding response OmpR family regulator
MNVLIVEDEARVADFVGRGLKAEGISTVSVSSAEQASEILSDQRFDAILLDVMLPGMNGIEFCRTLRDSGDRTPILILSALDETDQRVKGLRTGADDYLAKPFEFDELVARLEALHRRSGQFDTYHKHKSARLVGGHIEIDRESLQVFVNGVEVDVTEKEREILTLLLSNPNRVLSRERILNSVWGAHADPLTNVVDVYIGRLRKKMMFRRDQLVTVRGIGYRFFAGSAA